MDSNQLAQQAAVTDGTIRAKDLQDANKSILWLTVLGFIAFPVNPATALVGLPLLLICILRRADLKKVDGVGSSQVVG